MMRFDSLLSIHQGNLSQDGQRNVAFLNSWHGSVWGIILISIALLYPYRITVHHKLNEEDIFRRLTMCNLLHQKMEDHPDWINNVWFSDEAHFHINGAVNKYNNRFWGSETPDELKENSLKGKKVTAFCAWMRSMEYWGRIGSRKMEKRSPLPPAATAPLWTNLLLIWGVTFHPQYFGKFISCKIEPLPILPMQPLSTCEAFSADDWLVWNWIWNGLPIAQTSTHWIFTFGEQPKTMSTKTTLEPYLSWN